MSRAVELSQRELERIPGRIGSVTDSRTGSRYAPVLTRSITDHFRCYLTLRNMWLRQLRQRLLEVALDARRDPTGYVLACRLDSHSA